MCLYLVVSARSQRAKNRTSCHQPRDLLSTEAKIRTCKPHCCPATWQGRERMPEGRMPPRRPSYPARLPGRPCTGCCPLHSLSLVSDFTFYSGFCSQFATVRLPGWSAERSAPRTAPTVPGRQLGQHRKDLRTRRPSGPHCSVSGPSHDPGPRPQKQQAEWGWGEGQHRLSAYHVLDGASDALGSGLRATPRAAAPQGAGDIEGRSKPAGRPDCGVGRSPTRQS